MQYNTTGSAKSYSQKSAAAQSRGYSDFVTRRCLLLIPRCRSATIPYPADNLLKGQANEKCAFRRRNSHFRTQHVFSTSKFTRMISHLPASSRADCRRFCTAPSNLQPVVETVRPQGLGASKSNHENCAIRNCRSCKANQHVPEAEGISSAEALPGLEVGRRDL